MSLYNMLNGVNPTTFFFLPMLGEKHPDQYPRFRDCFIKQTEEGTNEIHVFTRTGGGNRGQGYGEEELQQHPNFQKTWDDEEDSTYGWYTFSVPDEWKDDFAKITNRETHSISQAYKERLYKVFPKLVHVFDEIFNQQQNNEV